MKQKGIIGVHHPSGMLIRDAIFGVNDGIVSMLALIAGLSAALMTNKVIIISALAESFAGALSMAIGSYISTKSQVEFMTHELQDETRNIIKKPKMERAHLAEIYRNKGFRGKELEAIVNKIMSNKKVWGDVMQREELGFSASSMQNPVNGGIVMFFSFLIASVIPLWPFFFMGADHIAFLVALFNGSVLLFVVGIGKTYFTGRHPLRSGIEMVVVGGIATALAYAVGTYIPLFLQ